MYYSFVFPKNNFIWDNTNKAYVSKGEIWLSNIKDKQTHALLDVYIIIEKRRNNDVLTIYLQTEFYDEYYFQYKNGVMKAWSTTNEFNEEILDVKEGKRRADAKRGKKPYRYTVALEEDKDKFLRLAKKKY